MFHASFRRNKIGMNMMITFELSAQISVDTSRCFKMFVQTRTNITYKRVYAVTMVTEKTNFSFVLLMDLFCFCWNFKSYLNTFSNYTIAECVWTQRIFWIFFVIFHYSIFSVILLKMSKRNLQNQKNRTARARRAKLAKMKSVQIYLTLN